MPANRLHPTPTNVNPIWKQVATPFQQEGVPVSVWQPIALAEGGGRINPFAVGDNNTSFGVFQLHKGGQLPASWVASAQEGYGPAYNPFDNSAAASVAINQAYRQGLKLGYHGLKLTEYVASHSGHPTNLPANVFGNSASQTEQNAVAKWYAKYGSRPAPVVANSNTLKGSNTQTGMVSTGFTRGLSAPKIGPLFSPNSTWANVLRSVYTLENTPVVEQQVSLMLSILGIVIIAVGIIAIIGLEGIGGIAGAMI